eukprot:TRINITY_DN5121_c0_g2_i1.p1 TRINITY_DN5121_c0_g2~~TRINITY_DN5121_c0_g2_i1.p1  ORF type:complete len:636 (+),score=74.36 TRINITY_DN5121_c0_g2_i1:47-1954(+)
MAHDQQRWMAGRPWRELPSCAGGSVEASGWQRSRYRQETPSPLATKPMEDTLYESPNGDFVATGSSSSTDGSQAVASRRCFVFSTEASCGTSAPSSFRCSQQVGHAAVSRGITPGSRQGGLLSVLQRWGQVGFILEKLVEQRGCASWLVLEYWFLSLVLSVLAYLRNWIFWLLGSRHSDMDSCAIEAIAPQASMSWHPDKDLLATLSPSGVVAVHSLGDPLSGGSSSQFLQGPEDGFGRSSPILCLEWQPNDLRGTLAIGSSAGVAIWRRGQLVAWGSGSSGAGSRESWHRVWCLQGEAFSCPAVTWSPDGRCLASAGPLGSVQIWSHSELLTEQDAPSCVTLRRWRSAGTVNSISWSPDTSVLAVLHRNRSGGEPLIRLWDTQTWEIVSHVGLGVPLSRAPSSPSSLSGGSISQCLSLAWLSRDTLLATGSERLVEVSLGLDGAAGLGGLGSGIRSQGSGLSAWLAGAEPTIRELFVPQSLLPEAAFRSFPPSERLQRDPMRVLEVAVCPRTTQRVALRIADCDHVVIFERPGCGLAGWTRRELLPCGLISATDSSSEGLSAKPLSIAFAAGRGASRLGLQGSGSSKLADLSSFEGSLLAVFWGFASSGEVRTYPMHYLPSRLLQSSGAASATF